MSPGLSAASTGSQTVDRVGTDGSPDHSEKRNSRLPRAAEALLLIAATVFFALHFVHLEADFPNGSPWMDWSKYTDEGWYGDAAIRQIQLGHWYVRGDFNPAAALPVWPALEFLLFSATGVSLAAARALSVSVFGGTLVAAYVLVRRCSMRSGSFHRGGIPLAPAAAAALLAVSPFCYAITRLAVLEPLLILLTLLALLAASSRKQFVQIAGLGILIPLMVLTKTTAVFLLPAAAWMLWASGGYRLRPLLRSGVPAAAIAGGLWSAYFFLLVRPRFLEDYRYLFSANGYTGMTRENAWSVIGDTLYHGFWMGRLMYPAAVAAVVVALACFRRSFQNPAVPCLLLWAAGYMGFFAYHNNLQPRYYLVIAVPLTVLIPVAAAEAIRSVSGHRTQRQRADAAAVAVAVSVVVSLLIVSEGAKTLHYALNPQYTFVQAAEGVRRTVMADPGHSHLILSISGSDLSLMTGLPSICDDFGTMPLEDRVALYKPGWYAAWNQVDDDKMDALAPFFHLVRVASFMAFDDPDRNLLILYRLDPPGAMEPPKQRRKAIPKQLRTRIGQQPSASQLEH